ncbi:MAG: hypothetical protein JWM87_4815 [Candidatus Eremiobacteraeota bacterium]|nr:hypothetical protein [Candidatus Eremiobacteraeota bacterium]
MIDRIGFRGAALAALVLLAACNRGSATCEFTAFPNAQVLPIAPRMISPAPGATGLPTSGFTVQVAFGNGAVNREVLRLVDQNQQTLLGGAFAPIVPPPTPPPVPAFVANEEAAVPQLAAHTTYTAFLDGASPVINRDCPPQHSGGPFTVQLGTFATQ